MKIQAAFDASSADVSPSYRGFTVQWTPTPPPKIHRRELKAQNNL
jgi:hypothetical protein